jgi:pyruvate/2-oxoglutarate dehydrogenase complex dihydrolipoamide dehydrogenase (E3) component
MGRARYDLIIVGMGSAGMTAAEFASTLPIKVCAIERDRVGGDCLWTGCVPSKALLASAKAAHTMRHADHYGLTAVEPEIDRARVWERVRAIQAQLAATTDAPEHFTDRGIELRTGEATFTPTGRSWSAARSSRPSTSCSARAGARRSRRSPASRRPAT